MSVNPQPNLLFIAYYYPPINAVGALRAGRFAKYLAEWGYHAAVVAGNASPGLEDSKTTTFVPKLNGASSALSRAGVLAGKVVQKLVTQHSDRMEWVPYAIQGAIPLLETGRIRAIFSTSPPIANHVAALWLRRHYNVKWIADFRDPLVGSPFRQKAGMRIHDRWLQRAIFEQADGLTTVTDAIAEEWTARETSIREKVRVIWNGFDPAELFGPAPRSERAVRIMAHVGDLYGGRHPGLLLSSMDRLIRRGSLDPSSIRLELIGPIETSGLDHNPSFERLKEIGVLHFNNQRVPREQAMEAIAQADYLLLLDLNEKNVGHTVPAKLFDYLRSGHPILTFTACRSVVDGILSKSGVPYVSVYPDEAESRIDEKVSSFFALDVAPVQPNEWFWQQFDGKRQAGTLAQLFDRILA